jgi:ribosomal peptide maturation radical SAM protein 1
LRKASSAVSVAVDSEHPVILACLPWAAVDQPSLQFGILASRLRSAGIGVRVCYLNLDFLEMVGPDVYRSYSEFHNDLADWAFARDLHNEDPNDATMLALAHTEGVPRSQLREIRRVAVLAGRFLDRCLASVDWASARIVGFTTSLLQTLAALALARRLATAHPHLTILLGGAGCQGSMGEALHRNFPFVDGVVRGEADATVVPLIESLLKGGASPRVPGLLWRQRDGRSYAIPTGKPPNLRDYRTPDYDDYFNELAKRSSIKVLPKILFEGSRGCWWAHRNPCRFCGLNGTNGSPRTRRVQSVVAELAAQRARYDATCFVAADNLVPTSHLKKLPSALPSELANSTFFFEVRPDVDRRVLARLASMGNVHIQTGVESLVPEVLELAGKGSSVLGGICLLRRARELGLTIHWNFMCGFPSEELGWYETLLPRLAKLFHLPGPDIVPLSLQRHSTYFESPEQFGIKVLGPRPAARLVWRLPDEELRDLCFSLEFDAPGRSNLPRIRGMLRTIVEDWQARQASLAISLRSDGRAIIQDWRGPERTYLLPPVLTEVLRFLEAPTSLAQVATRLRQSAPARYLALGGARGLHAAVLQLETMGLVWRERKGVVALPVPSGDAFWVEAGGNDG